MDKINLKLNPKEQELLKQCAKATKIPARTLLRCIVISTLHELQADLEKNGEIICVFRSETKKNDDIKEELCNFSIEVSPKDKELYNMLLKPLPIVQSRFLTYLIIPKLKNLQEKKISTMEVIA